jgi:hypothetical protein
MAKARFRGNLAGQGTDMASVERLPNMTGADADQLHWPGLHSIGRRAGAERAA